MTLTTLNNGLRICARPISGVETATVTLLAGCGSRHEPAALNGIAHLFEHMVFKGAGDRSARELSEAIEDVGGELNACTERDSTSFTASVLAEHVPLAMELLGDLLIRPQLSDSELEREKQVVLQELAEARDTPSDIIFDELWAAAFADQPLGRSILGSEASIEAISAADLRAWRESHYRGANLILVAAGKVDHDNLLSLAETHFADLKAGGEERVAQARFTSADRRCRMPSEQAHITLALEGPAILAPDYHAARLFADIVGGGASSRLFQEVREERGLAYSVSASLQGYDDTGIFSVHAATSRADAALAGQLIDEIVARAATDINQREVDRARNQARAGMMMHLESSWGQASYAARQISIHGRLVAPSEALARIDALSVEDVRRAGAAMLDGPRARATIGLAAAQAA